jgi:membrane protein YdbS with pleckstrin-like domain
MRCATPRSAVRPLPRQKPDSDAAAACSQHGECGATTEGMDASPSPTPPDDRVFFTTRLHWIVLVPSLLLALAAWTLRQWSMHDVFLDLGLPAAAWWWDDASMASIRATGLELDALLSNLAAALALATLLISFLRTRYTRVVVTSTRIVLRHGILRSREDDVPYQCVDGLFVSRGLLGRVFGYGTVKVAGPGADARWRSVDRPDALCRAAEARLTAWLCRDLGGTPARRRAASA